MKNSLSLLVRPYGKHLTSLSFVTAKVTKIRKLGEIVIARKSLRRHDD
jgi:hypothetical protein